MVRICPACSAARPQTEFLCQALTATGGFCHTDLSYEALIRPGLAASKPAASPRPVERWFCANGHEAAPGDELCACGELVRMLAPDDFAPPRTDEPVGVREHDQLPLVPLEPLETRIGRWRIAGVSLEADSASGSHPCESGTGELGELHFAAENALFEALLAACSNRVRAILDRGDWNGRRFVILERLPAVPWSARFGATEGIGLRAFVEQLGGALNQLHLAGFRLRTLHPGNIFARPGEGLDFALTGLADAVRADDLADPPPLTSLNVFYAAPEVLAGGHAAHSDWWSLGAIILDHVTNGGIFEGIHPSVWRMHAVTADVPLPGTLDPAVDLLLRGLLARDLAERWQWREVQAWLNGEAVKAPARGAVAPENGSPLALAGVLYRSLSRYAIAAASEQHWDEAKLQFERGELLAWCTENSSPEEMIAGLRRVSASPIDPEFKFGIALKCLYRDLPLVRSGVIINPAWLLHNLDEGYHFITGPIPDLLERLGFEPELVRLKERASSARSRAAANQIVLDEASFRTRLLATNTRKLMAEWEARRADFPESDHRGIARTMRRLNIGEEDLIVLNSAALTQFRSRPEIIKEAVDLARQFQLAFAPREAEELIRARPGRDILAQTEGRIADFARCGIAKIDEWADSLRQHHQLPLAKALLVLAVPRERWQKPEGLEYTARILSFFENKIALSIKRGPLARMTVTKTSDRIDLSELGTDVKPASQLLEAVVERSAASVQIHPAALQATPGLEWRFRRLMQRASQYKRDTGIDCLYLGFPFILHQPLASEVKPRIAPLFLWPIKVGGGASIAADRDRDVLLNPALDGFLKAAEVADCRAALKEVETGGSIISVLDECMRIVSFEGKSLVPLPAADVKVKTNRIVPAAVLFNAVYPGQSLINDLQSLQQIPALGTALATLLRLKGAEAPAPERPREAEKYFVAEIDPSQEAAVMRARHGAGVLIEGPPGTGKSQTIVNLIADAIGRGKSLLFICQKQAALDVVFNRLIAAQLQDRIVLIRDEGKDRRSVVQALRAQALSLAALAATGMRGGGRRAELAAQIDRLEAEIDAHHEAFYLEHAAYDRSYADILTELIVIEGEDAPLPKVRGLRSLLGSWSPLTVAAVAEQCATLARDWLPARYEGSQLAALKLFHADQATVEEFREDFAAFRVAEERRATVLETRPAPFIVENPEATRSWLAAQGAVLENLADELCADLKRWSGKFYARSGQIVEAKALAEELAAIQKSAGELEDTRSSLRMTPHLWSALLAENEGSLETWLALINRCAEPVTGIARFSLGRYFAKRKVERYLSEAANCAKAGIDFAAYGKALAAELESRRLQERFDRINQALDMRPTADAPSTAEIDALARRLAERLQAVWTLVAQLGSCPRPDRAVSLAAKGEPQAFTQFGRDLRAAADRAEARIASLNALEPLASWFEETWLSDMRASISAEERTEDKIIALSLSINTLPAYQRFRSKAQNMPRENWAALEKLREAERALEAIPADDLEGVVRRLINREARLAWKSSIEREWPALHADRENLQSKVTQLGMRLEEIRAKNRETLQEGIDLRRIVFDQRWQKLTLLQGPNALGLRDIVERGLDLGLMTLRPVWLMNPDVASRALPLKAGLFDIVVFDEASQIPVENALPALFRGKQVIVSGDEKQLPPSTFFSSAVDDADDSDDEISLDSDATEDERAAAEQAWTSNEIKDCPDLLHLARSALLEDSRVMLKVHYRSEWRELIAYSNAAFYDGALSVPIVRPDGLIREAMPMEVLRVDGLYSKQTNEAEAQAIVGRVAQIWAKARSDRLEPPTLGVVTFNLKQADLIEDLLYDRRSRDDAFAADYETQSNRVGNGADLSFFVKNLENVQGDERDIIVFSTTFGKDAQGKFRRNFGVLGQQGGERRLNVAITRARQKMIVATSMPIEQISDCLAQRRRPERPRDFLQLYMHYINLVSEGQLPAARSLVEGMTQARQNRRNGALSSFAAIVGGFLEREGVRTVSIQDGSAFAVDFAVEDETTGRFRLGIECEAPRHPLLTAARARELWRPRSLREALPMLHRVSMQGWLKDSAGEQERLLHAIYRSRKAA
jgi:primosomal replication protein N''